MSMKLMNYIDIYIEEFATLIGKGEGWIAKDDVLRQFTTRFDKFVPPGETESLLRICSLRNTVTVLPSGFFTLREAVTSALPALVWALATNI
jgi:hypothetical protein